VTVDWDLLADHLGGALVGTPEGARVERLVATDPSWAHAASELSAALDAVAADLRTVPTLTMPDDVADRLTAALDTAAAPGVPAPAGSPSAGRAVDGSRRPPTHPGSRRPRRRMSRWSAGLAVAAGVATFAAIGLGSWLGSWDPGSSLLPGVDDGGGADSETAREPAPQLEDAPERPQETTRDLSTLIVATGNEYDQDTLADTAPPERPDLGLGGADEPSPPPVAPSAPVQDGDVPGSVPEPLFRLWADPEARAACLALIMSALRPPPVTIDAVDFATFEGEPAVVIWATTGDAQRWAWVSGPDCGEVAGNPDVQFETQLS
jgi:hypothetical protein